ncbi:ABC transporter ATP-binding protein [Polluticaenibacter yanchengensis]|uniref:ATP-binding cassette domain-containing protein n=1 Tax=Polluticaenibacter yanchengensis TaxID=3014562 RepID=A0ABT4UJF9_9BACT|nr:ATP-binding cassette domain-containing protein [Chitinophagaceae bacterium LY-5]
MSTVFKIQQLTKFYGPIHALNNVSIDIPKGSIFGLLGPNGSGKTTMLGIIMNITIATSGTVLFNDTPLTADGRKKIGTLLETPNFYHYLSAYDNLKITATIKGIKNPDIDGVLKQVNLYERRFSKFQTFSLGMKQRLAIATCLLGDPEVMIFDEPTNGLDPVGINEIRNLIKSLAKNGKTIVMASHLLDEVEKVCTHVAILKKGNLLVQGGINQIMNQDDMIELNASNHDLLLETVRQIPHYIKHEITDNGNIMVYVKQGTVDTEGINQLCFKNGIVLNTLSLKTESLENIFIGLTS